MNIDDKKICNTLYCRCVTHYHSYRCITNKELNHILNNKALASEQIVVAELFIPMEIMHPYHSVTKRVFATQHISQINLCSLWEMCSL